LTSVTKWPDGVMFKALDLQLRGYRIDSQPFCCQASCSHTCLITKQYKTVLVKKQRYHRSGSHRVKWFIHLLAQALSKGDEYPTYTPHGVSCIAFFIFLQPRFLQLTQ